MISVEQMRRSLSLPTIAGFILLGTTSANLQSGNLKALVGGPPIDGFGSKTIRQRGIIIEGEKIKAVGQVGSLAVPVGAEIISTEGMTVLPGLWDMHAHLMINGHS